MNDWQDDGLDWQPVTEADIREIDDYLQRRDAAMNVKQAVQWLERMGRAAAPVMYRGERVTLRTLAARHRDELASNVRVGWTGPTGPTTGTVLQLFRGR